ncbi:hypothetical protein ACFE04_022488 [Oxalis oulophora]
MKRWREESTRNISCPPENSTSKAKITYGDPRTHKRTVSREKKSMTWHCPPKFDINYKWRVATGGEGKEMRHQRRRETQIREVHYPRRSAIPSNPYISSRSWGNINDDDDSKTPIVPLVGEEDRVLIRRNKQLVLHTIPHAILVIALKSAEQRKLIDLDFMVQILSDAVLVGQDSTPMDQGPDRNRIQLTDVIRTTNGDQVARKRIEAEIRDEIAKLEKVGVFYRPAGEWIESEKPVDGGLVEGEATAASNKGDDKSVGEPFGHTIYTRRPPPGPGPPPSFTFLPDMLSGVHNHHIKLPLPQQPQLMQPAASFIQPTEVVPLPPLPPGSPPKTPPIPDYPFPLEQTSSKFTLTGGKQPLDNLQPQDCDSSDLPPPGFPHILIQNLAQKAAPSVSVRAENKKRCIYFRTSSGCRRGVSCRYRHESSR